MFERKKIMWLYGLTSAHVGSGDNLSYVDLPIQRETHTGFPKIEASSLKGSIRQAMEQKDIRDTDGQYPLTNKLLGSLKDGEVASAVSISDARILFFPVKSAKGVFAWVTSPMAIQRFYQDCRLVDFKELSELLKKINFELQEPRRCTESILLVDNESQILLEEYDFKPNVCPDFENLLDLITTYLPNEEPLLKKDEFKKRVMMVSDNDFRYFVTQSTEVTTRIKVSSKTGIVEKGALFTEEYLPPESILYSLLFLTGERVKENGLAANDIESTMNKLLIDKLLQIGGDKTHGKGLFSISIREEGEKNE